jgi:hypothetical protein
MEDHRRYFGEIMNIRNPIALKRHTDNVHNTFFFFLIYYLLMVIYRFSTQMLQPTSTLKCATSMSTTIVPHDDKLAMSAVVTATLSESLRGFLVNLYLLLISGGSGGYNPRDWHTNVN